MFARTVSLLTLALGCATVPTATSVAPAQEVSEPFALREPTESRPALAPTTLLVPVTSAVEPKAEARPRESSADAAVEYRTPLLDEAALAEAARAACEAAEASARPVLLEFSASWCEDCLTLERLKTAAPLAQEIERWELFVVNVGGGFEHPALMRVFRVDAIAKLVVVEPRRCADPLTTWRQGRSRTLDGMAKQQDRAGAELSAWLGEERRQSERERSAH